MPLRLHVQDAIEELRQRRELLGPSEVQARAPQVIRLGLTPLDQLLGGGLPLGRVVVLAPGSGGLATSVALRLLACVTAAGHLAAWCDRADAFDLRGAVRSGVDLNRLLWCRPASQRSAARAADALLGSGVFSLVVLDLGGAAREPRPVDSSWLRLARRAETSRASLLVLGESTVPSVSALTLRPERGRALFSGEGSGRTFEGVEVSLELVRNKLGLAPGQALLQLRVSPDAEGEP